MGESEVKRQSDSMETGKSGHDKAFQGIVKLGILVVSAGDFSIEEMIPYTPSTRLVLAHRSRSMALGFWLFLSCSTSHLTCSPAKICHGLK